MRYRKLIAVLILLSGALAVNAQQFSDTKTYIKSFRVGTRPVLDVSNKYGNIHISHIRGDSVNVRVEITATSNNESRIRNMMSDTDISITMTNETIRAHTIFGQSVITLFESFKGLTKNLMNINYESRLEVNYFVECPSSTILRLTNSYGDVYIGEETPELSLALSNGSLSADRIRNALLLDLSFCKADIRIIEKGHLSLSFGELRTEETGDIGLVTRSSKIWIDKAGEISLDSKRDYITIGTIRSLSGSTYFTDITTDNLNDNLSIICKYGNLSFENVSQTFSLIDINSSYADVDIALAARASFDMEIHHTNSFVSMPGISPEPVRKEINAENKVYITTARIGNTPDRSRIRIEAVKGEIRILQK